MALTRVPPSGVLTNTQFTLASVAVTATTIASSTITGAVTIAGGLGVGGNIWVGGTINASITGVATTATNLAGGTAGQFPYQTAPGVTSFAGPGSYGQFLMSTGAGAPVYQSTLTQVNGNIIVGTGPDTPTFSTTTGLLQILNGGVGIGKSLWVGTTATVAGTLKVGGTVSNDIVLTSSQIYRSGGSVSIGGGNSSAPNITGTAGFVAGNNSTADIYGGSGAVNLRPNANYQVVVYSNSSTFSTQTGGLQIVNGGVGIGGGMYVGGIITATNVYVNGYAVSTASALTIQGAGVSLGSAGTINFATGTIVTVGSNLANVWLNTATLMQVATQVVQSLSTGTGILGGSYNGSTAQTWSLNTATLMANAVTAINLAGGTAGQLAYQTGAGTTSFAGTATTGNFLQANYTGAPTWTSTGSMYVYRATQADSASGSAGSVANALTIGTGLSGTSASYNGSAAVTISLNTATLVQTATQVVQSHSTGTGILGSAYNGSTAQTWTLDTSTLMARSVQTVQSLTAGTGLSGTAFNGSTAQTWTLNTATLMQIATQVVQAVTFNNSNTGDASGTTYNGGTARTVSANTLGALSLASGGTISGAVTFSGPVTFSGTATYVSSTQTYYTDNIINLHVPPGGVDAGWTLDDGKDIGLRFHYFNSTDTNAALVLANDSKFLEWYAAGAEGTSTFVGSYYGNFKTGNIVAGRGLRVGSLASSTATVVGEKLYVSGGIYATDYITATTFVGAMSQSITAGTGLTGTAYNGGTAQTWSLNTATLMQVATQVVQSHSTGTGILGSAYNGSTAQTWSLDTSTLMNKVVNLASGAAGSLPYQSGANATTYLGIGTSGYILTSNGSAPTWTAANGLSAGSATTATSAGTAYATIGTLTAGTGLSGTAFNGSANQTWTLNTATLVQTATQVVQSISAGTGLTGTAYNGSTAQTWSLNTATLMANAVTAINLSAGSAMAVPYQSASGTTAYLAAGTSGYVLQTNGTGSAPSWVAASTLAAGSAPLTNTYVGYGSASNLLTGSSNVTWDGSKFYVNGILDITGNSSPTGTGLTLGYSSTGGYKWIQSFNSQPLYINPLGNNVIFNRDGGSVGIGTTSPSGKLHVYTGSASGAIAYFEGDSGRYLYTGVDSGHYIEQVGTSSGNRNLRIQSSNGAGTYTVLYVDGANQRIYTSSNASVGIGTSSPVATLDVRGGLAVSGWSNNNGGSSGGLEIGWDSTQGLIQSYNRTGSAYTAITLNGSINKFLTGGTERLRITSSGGMAFGGSTNYGSSGQILQSNGDASPSWVNASSITSGYASNETLSTVATRGNSYINGSLGGISIGETFTNYDGWSTQLNVHGVGSHARLTVKTGTVRMGVYAHDSWNAVSGTTPGGFVGTYNNYPLSFIINAAQKMVIDTSGNVGINTTSPSEKLHVNSGNIRIDTGSIRIFQNGSSSISSTFYMANAANGQAWNWQLDNNGYAALFGYVINGGWNRAITVSTNGLGGYLGLNSNTSPSYLIDTAPANGTTTDTDRIRFAPYNGPSGGTGGYNYGSTTGAGTSLGTGIVWAPNYSGYSKRSAGILNIAEGNYFRSGLAFYTNNIADSTTDWTEAMRIGSNGNVQIGGGSSPSLTNKFEVDGSNGQLFSVTDSFTGTIFSANDISGIPSIEILDTGLVKFAQYNGSVAISTSTAVSGSALSVYGIISTIGTAGEIRASSEITAYYSSDARLKENVSVISNPIEILTQITGVYFDWTDEHIARRGGEDGFFVRKHDIGVIAQEVEAVLPEIVATREDGYKAVKYEKIVPLLIEAVKSQQQTIDTLKAELQEIKDLIKGK